MSDQQANQAVLASALGSDLPAAWSTLNIDQLQDTMPTFVASVAALVQQYGRTSALIAAKHYQAERYSAGIAGKITVRLAKPANFDQVNEGIRWATKALWSATPDVDAAKSLVQGVAERAVLDTGRNTLLDAIKSDRKAKGWARVCEPGACSFCLLLATRGAVYREHSFTNANFKFSGPGAFKAHNNCRCTLQPIFGPYEPSADIRHWQSVYRTIAQTHSGAAARRAFRQAVAVAA
jgi:hypothetical protein